MNPVVREAAEPSGDGLVRPAYWCVLIGALALGLAGCGGNQPSQFNRSPSITSIGPLTFNGRSVVVNYTLQDREGDDQAVYVGVCEGKDPGEGVCPAPVEGAASDGLKSLPTVPRGRDVSHQFAWNVGCGRIGSGSCLATKLDQEYLLRIRLQGTDQQVTSETFSLADTFELDSVPDCDRSAGTIPDPCPPGDPNSQ